MALAETCPPKLERLSVLSVDAVLTLSVADVSLARPLALEIGESAANARNECALATANGSFKCFNQWHIAAVQFMADGNYMAFGWRSEFPKCKKYCRWISVCSVNPSAETRIKVVEVIECATHLFTPTL